MRFIYMLSANTLPDYQNQFTRPCPGYYTNIMVQFSDDSTNGFVIDFEFFFGTNIPTFDQLTELLNARVEMSDYNKNGVHVKYTQGDIVDNNTDNPRWLYRYFGSSRIYVDHDDNLGMRIVDFPATDALIIIEADFVPFEGTKFQQVMTMNEQDPDALGWFVDKDQTYIAPINLENVYVTIHADFESDTGKGKLFLKKFDNGATIVPTTASTGVTDTNTDGDVLQSSTGGGSGVSGIQHVAMVSMSSDEKDLNVTRHKVGRLRKGDMISWMYVLEDAGTSTLAVVMDIEAVVGKNKKPRRGHFLEGNQLHDLGQGQLAEASH